MEIVRLGEGDDGAVLAAGQLFDEPPDPAATRRFLAGHDHHLLVAYAGDGKAVGFVSGVETTHPDKGTEMFLYELGVEEGERRRGVGRALVEALAALARERGCHAMWTGTEPDNAAALATYARAGASPGAPTVILEWALSEGGARSG